MLADYGNKASMEAYGYKKFTESDYWPIKSAKEGLHSNIEKGGNNTRSIKNIGMAKTTIPHVSNALDLAGIFTTFANHASDMTDYASWLCTMEDINRLSTTSSGTRRATQPARPSRDCWTAWAAPAVKNTGTT